MASNISIFCALSCILVQVPLLIAIRSEFSAPHGNETERTSPRKLGRSKRALADTLPRYLKLKVQYAADEQIDLQWTMITQHLANEHLRVSTPFIDFSAHVMANVGEFVMYHDQQRCSAVVYFENLKVLYGVIGMNYHIVALPFDFNERGEYNSKFVGAPYIKKIQDTLNHIHPHNALPPLSDTAAWRQFIPLFTSDPDHNLKRKPKCDAGPSSKRRHTEHSDDGVISVQEADTSHHSATEIIIPKKPEYYSETLIFVTHDIAELFKSYFGRDHYVGWIVRHFIVYFNAIDMMFQKLRTPVGGISINIAKIVIEDDSVPFDFIVRDGVLEFSDIVAKLPKYLDANSERLSPDSFDHVFIQTRRTIMDDVIPMNGMTKSGADLYEARKQNRFSHAVPITIMTYQLDFVDYEFAVHEMGKIFNLKIDLPEKGLNHLGQCYGLMQLKGPKCDNCLKWSPESSEQMQTFLTTNRNRCFLLNRPRSLHLPAVRQFLLPHDQCRCFGYHYNVAYSSGFRKNSVGYSDCDKPLRCVNENDPELVLQTTVRPFDGTPCTTSKVCWNRKCTPLTRVLPKKKE